MQAVAFAALTDPWVHGALLVVFVVAGLGLFVMLSWLLARLLAPRALPLPADSQAEAASAPPSQPQRPGDAQLAAHALAGAQAPGSFQPQRPGDALGPVPKLGARRARATR
jgi:hypothetical protein